MLGIFIIKTAKDLEHWKEFKKDLPYGKRTWTVDDPCKEVNFLDLNINVDHKGLITTKTFQKKMNFYLYIPPYSAHPPGLFKSIIYSTIRRYWIQNSIWKDFTEIVTQFYRRLLHRGYRSHSIDPTFVTTLYTLTQGIPFYSTDSLAPLNRKEMMSTKVQQSNKNGKNLYFHLRYHPKGISSKSIQSAYASAFNTERTLKRTENKGNKTNHISKGLHKGIQCRYASMSEIQVD